MQATFSIHNTAGVKRLTIGVTGRDGKRAEIKFIASSTREPLVAQAPELPTERDMNVQYLLAQGWERGHLDGVGSAFGDPLTGSLHGYESALCIQNARDIAVNAE